MTTIGSTILVSFRYATTGLIISRYLRLLGDCLDYLPRALLLPICSKLESSTLWRLASLCPQLQLTANLESATPMELCSTMMPLPSILTTLSLLARFQLQSTPSLLLSWPLTPSSSHLQLRFPSLNRPFCSWASIKDTSLLIWEC